jgi:hypothetical protein
LRHRVPALLAATLTLMLAITSTAIAHPDHSDEQSGRELFPGEGIAGSSDKQHDGDEGHLPPVKRHVDVIGKAEVTAPEGTNGDLTGRVADVSAHGDYAYLTAFRAADCLGGGAWVVDISDPTAPHEVGFLPTTDGSYAGEGSQVITADYGDYAGRQLFLHQNETCDAAMGAATGKSPYLGGINIWDVTDPLEAELLVEHAGDTDGVRANPNTVHSMYAWNSHVDERVYAVLVDNVEWTDVDIMDITDPTNPVMVNDTLDLVDLFDVGQDSPSNLTSIFNHDMMVYRMGDRYVMNVNYWDGGYVLLDVTDPTPGNVTLIAESDYAELDEERLKRGHEITPEGNAHQSELSPDFDYLIGTDEDFNPYRVVATITSGAFAGTEFSAVSASDTPDVDENTTVSGATTYVGRACGPVPAGEGIALIERGDCAFQDKIDNVTAAGYDAGLVFNIAGGGCNGFVRMLAAGDIPFLFVQRETGLQILGQDVSGDAACTAETPAPGSPSADVHIEAVFDGWGYVRLFRTDIPKEVGAPGSITQIDTYAIPESQDAAYASGFGDLSVHEVAIDPRRDVDLAYFSYYAGGFRVVEYGQKGLKEVGAFIDEGGNNFWGVEVHEIDGETYVLASDRDFGLYIFQYAPPAKGGGNGPPGPPGGAAGPRS